MYRFEIHGEESADSGVRYHWKLFSAGDDGDGVVATSQPFSSRAEAESGVRAFRHGVARARVGEEPRDGQLEPAFEAVTFRRLPYVVSLPVTMSRRHGPHAPEAGPGRHRPRSSADAEAGTGTSEARTDTTEPAAPASPRGPATRKVPETERAQTPPARRGSTATAT